MMATTTVAVAVAVVVDPGTAALDRALSRLGWSGLRLLREALAAAASVGADDGYNQFCRRMVASGYREIPGLGMTGPGSVWQVGGCGYGSRMWLVANGGEVLCWAAASCGGHAVYWCQGGYDGRAVVGVDPLASTASWGDGAPDVIARAAAIDPAAKALPWLWPTDAAGAPAAEPWPVVR